MKYALCDNCGCKIKQYSIVLKVDGWFYCSPLCMANSLMEVVKGQILELDECIYGTEDDAE